MRIFAISDIHGCLTAFEDMLSLIKLQKTDRLIVLGDSIDRGTHSIEVVLKIRELKDQGYDIITLRGNHEQMVLDTLSEYKSMACVESSYIKENLIRNGTYDTLKSYFEADSDIQAAFVSEISQYKDYHIEGDYLLVHAGVCPSLSLDEQSEDCFLWIREEFIYSKHGLPYVIIFGHTPTRHLSCDSEDVIWFQDDKIGIDCACVRGGSLSCLELYSLKEYYVKLR